MPYDWEKERQEMLDKVGLPGLTKAQYDAVMEPSEAPENYHCDGEISPKQAYSRWIQSLKELGLNDDQVGKAIKLNFGV